MKPETKQEQAERMVEFCTKQMAIENELKSHRCYQFLRLDRKYWQDIINKSKGEWNVEDTG